MLFFFLEAKIDFQRAMVSIISFFLKGHEGRNGF